MAHTDPDIDIDWLPDPALPLRRFDFDVALSTHDLLQQGITDAFWARIIVMAPTDHAAHLMAAHMAATVHGASMVTDIRWRI